MIEIKAKLNQWHITMKEMKFKKRKRNKQNYDTTEHQTWPANARLYH